jgi:hypothetical protein
MQMCYRVWIDDVYKLPLQEFQKGNPENLTEGVLYGIVEDPLHIHIKRGHSRWREISRRFQYIISYAGV